eukprot:TRINITY_DN21768_c0_g1_i1.p5 TRINITY_DN21768_c0_g1~~TRINITY_DN21768_c0_g1_i1.p5  ORF type:complete len:120 (-),score=9.46 TRINITY_DN21768_c0_g1_i1:70-429(-)
MLKCKVFNFFQKGKVNKVKKICRALLYNKFDQTGMIRYQWMIKPFGEFRIRSILMSYWSTCMEGIAAWMISGYLFYKYLYYPRYVGSYEKVAPVSVAPTETDQNINWNDKILMDDKTVR